MSWLEFISSLIVSLVWPVSILLIFLLFKVEIRAFLVANQVKLLKGGPFEAEFFESVSKAKEALKEGADSEPDLASQDSNQTQSSDAPVNFVFSDDLLLEHHPEYAVLESWKHLEGVLQLAANVRSGSQSRFRPIRQVIFELSQGKVISASLAAALIELNDARNAIVHGNNFKLTRKQAEEYIEVVEAALQSLQNFSEGNN